MLVLFCLGHSAYAQVSVISTIRPLEFIVTAIVGDSGSTLSLISASDSAHSFALTPQDRLALEQAEILLWIAPEFELYLTGLFTGLKNEKTVITVAQLPGLKLHYFEDGSLDPHLWLNPANGIVIARALTAELEQRFPQQQQLFRTRLANLEQSLEQLTQELKQDFASASGISYLVYHEAYQYFETAMGLQNAGALLHNPEIEPGIRGLMTLRQLVASSNPACIILEPDSSVALVDTVVQDLDIPRVTIDLLGYDIDNSEFAYAELIQSVATGFNECFYADQ